MPRRHLINAVPIVRDRTTFRECGQFPSQEFPREGEPLAILTGSSMLGGAQVTVLELAPACRAVGFDPTLVICRPTTAHPEVYKRYNAFPCRRMTFEDFARLPDEEHRKTHLFAQGLYNAGAGKYALKLLSLRTYRTASMRHASSCGLYPLRDWMHPQVRHIFVNTWFALQFDVGSLYSQVRLHVLPPHIAFDWYARPLDARLARWTKGKLVAGRAQRPDARKFDAATYPQWDQLRDMGIAFRTLGRDPRGLEPKWWEVVAFASVDVRDFYSTIDVMLYQTDRVCQEAAGRIIPESMAQGVIPVVNDWGGMAAYVTHGVDGFIYHSWTDAKHYLACLRDDLALRERMARAAQEKARTFDVIHYARALWSALHEPVADPLVFKGPAPGRYAACMPPSPIPGVPILPGR